MRILAVIPARGGSKSIPRKNIAPVAGRPLIAWTADAAKGSRLVNRLVISTDDYEIAEIAQKYGVEVPFIRPAELARDGTPGIEPIVHTLTWLDAHEGYRPDYVLVLQPTSPLRKALDIDAALQLAEERDADGVVSVSPAHPHPYWMKCIGEDGRLIDFLPSGASYASRQDLPQVYALNGAIYLAKRDIFLDLRTFYTEHTYAYVMPTERSLDVDSPWDLWLAGLILENESNRAAD